MTEEIRLPWEGWTITECIGVGAYGSVYRARFRPDESEAAVKIIQIPADESEAAIIAHDHTDPEDQKAYYEGIVESLRSEIHTMELLRENPNAVRLQDYCIEHAEGTFQWTIYIRMELLTPFTEYEVMEEIDEAAAIRLGMDICNVLEVCSENNIIHRDIKPENIMTDDEGRFKLGDFGIVRKLEQTTRGLSLKGTFAYMAPEVYHGEQYDTRVDQYSLGIVLYRLMNNNRDPFVDPDCQIVSFKDREDAIQKRMSGEVLPHPKNASELFGKIIRKACAYRPENRFEKIGDMKTALEACLKGKTVNVTGLVEISEDEQEEIARNRLKKKRRIGISIVAAILIAAISFSIWAFTSKETLPEWVTYAKECEVYVEKNGIQKDNSLEELDIEEVVQNQSRINDPSNEDAADVLGQIAEWEAELKKENIMDRADYDYCKQALIYLDDTNAVGLSVNYSSVIDNTVNAEYVTELIPYSLYYFSKIDGEWFQMSNDNIPEEVWDAIREQYLPEACVEALKDGRNTYISFDSFWAFEDAVYDSHVALRTAAVWQNEDGSVDAYLICRNGTDSRAAVYSYWFWLDEATLGDILVSWGHLEAGEVMVEANNVGAYTVHFEPEEVNTGTAAWNEADMSDYTSGYNSNYSRETN